MWHLSMLFEVDADILNETHVTNNKPLILTVK
jgi:hypothetical protein